MNAIQRNIARLHTLLDRLSLNGISRGHALLLEIPRLLVARAYNRLGSIAYALIDRGRFLDARIRQSLDDLVEEEGTCFFVIVVPSVLHFLIPAACLLRQQARLVFVLNGVISSEREVLGRQFPDIPMIELWSFPKTVWPHGYVLSLLLRTSKCDFGICDHDFFLFDRSVSDQLIFRRNEFAICATSYRNTRTGAEFPGTHFLYLRVRVIRSVMERYGAGAQLYKRIPRQVAPALGEMGLSLSNPPKDYQSFFDSFLLLSALSIHDGLTIRKLDLSAGDWEHIGGTSIGARSTKDPLHHYASCRFLDLLQDPAISDRYSRQGLATSDKTGIFRRHASRPLADRIDRLICKIRSQCADDLRAP